MPSPVTPVCLPACLCHIHGTSLHPYRCRRRHSGAIRFSINSIRLSSSACISVATVSQIAAHTLVFPLVYTYTYVARGRWSQYLYEQSSDARAIGVVGGRASQVGLRLIKNLLSPRFLTERKPTHLAGPRPFLPQPQFHVSRDCWYVYHVCAYVVFGFF